jgi:D-glycero-D-manno-heptose 1,7-bisphosphate phosphatase
MQILPGVVETIVLLNQAGFRVIVISNQRGVAKGLITAADLEALHRQLCEVLVSAGATIDAIYYCPHESEPPCRCRKPKPGLLLDAAREHNIDRAASWMIGDSRSDIEAGCNAGCKTALLGKDDSLAGGPDMVAASLLEAVQQVLQREEVLADLSCHRSKPQGCILDLLCPFVCRNVPTNRSQTILIGCANS